MKRLLAALALAVVVGGIMVWFKPPSGSQQIQTAAAESPTIQTETIPFAVASDEADPPDSSPDNTIPEPPGPVLPKAKPVALAALEELPAQLESQEPNAALPPVTALENVRTTIRQYTMRFGENPVGDNSEITAALNGKNPKRIAFLNSDDGVRINAKGQLVDNWDTPYFFHQLSRTEMEIHSAGPDRRMWSADDLVIK